MLNKDKKYSKEQWKLIILNEINLILEEDNNFIKDIFNCYFSVSNAKIDRICQKATDMEIVASAMLSLVADKKSISKKVKAWATDIIKSKLHPHLNKTFLKWENLYGHLPQASQDIQQDTQQYN